MSAVPQTAIPSGRRLLPGRFDDGDVTAVVSDPVLTGRSWRLWWIALAATLPFVIATVVGLLVVLGVGVGTWGINSDIVWGVAIADYVWWIGIGNAGTLISSLLAVTRQDWRASINRFAEAMTLFAVSIAGIFPIIHLGRPQYFYWLAPYRSTMTLWPQWRSALVWDFWAILSYLVFSLLFWYLGLIPDAATLRDRATTRRAQLVFGILALGWRGSVRHWRVQKTLHLTLAALAVPLVCSVHSIVGLDFAASLMPGWQETIFPPYFVVGAMYSGFAMVVILAICIRWGLGLQSVITRKHFDAMGLVILFCALVMTLSYATEWVTAWYGGDPDARGLVAHEFTGLYAPLYWLLILFNCVLPQLLWWPSARGNLLVLALVSVGINVGMWFERILIIWNTLGHNFLPSANHPFELSAIDWTFIIGPLGCFAFLFLVFCRFFPVVSMYEVRELANKEAGGAKGRDPVGLGSAHPVSAATRPVVAEFAGADAVLKAVDGLQRGGVRIADALTPYPLPELARRLGGDAGPLRPVMATAGFAVALAFLALEIWSQAYAYPFNSGGRPLVSWQVYYLVPFETGVLAAAVAGYGVMFWRTGLPRYHHPVFSVPGLERATQDRFFLIIDAPAGELDARRHDKALFETGAISLREVGP